MKTYIKNGRVINPATSQDDIYDVVIDGDRVLQVAKDLEPEAGAEVIDASGKYVMPGFIDLHVHFRDPGLTYKEDIETGAKAAARGGVTTVCAMPNTKPVVDSVETLSYIQKKAEEVAPIHVEQLSAITIGQNGTELVDMKAMVEQGAIAFSEDGKSVMDVTLYAEAMKRAAELDAVVMAHCEAAQFSKLATVMLEDAGMVVTRASDGKEVVELFKNHPRGTYDIILMDIMMPNMDGYQATKTIRAMEMERPDASTIPIIALSANAFAEDIKDSVNSGMNGHVSKPFDMEEVTDTIAKHVKS